MTMRSVLVIGGTGFVGRAVVDRVGRELAPGGTVVSVGSRDVDLSDKQATLDWFTASAQRHAFDHVIHLAALYKAGDWPVHHPATQFHVNMAINVNVLEACRRALPNARLTNILSYCMYPSTEDPHPESELWGTEPEDYLFAYALTKKALLIGSRAYRQEFGMNCASLVLPTVYGPGDSFAENSHVMGALVGKFVRAVRDGQEEVEVWGDGRQQREFLFIEDAADGIIAVALHSKADVLNIGVGQAHEIGLIASSIGKAAGFTGRVRLNENRFVGVRKRVLDVTRAREELGWSARTTIEEGIRKTVEWYRSQLSPVERRA